MGKWGRREDGWSAEELGEFGAVERWLTSNSDQILNHHGGPWGDPDPMDFAFEKIGISQLYVETYVFLHTFGDLPRNHQKSI